MRNIAVPYLSKGSTYLCWDQTFDGIFHIGIISDNLWRSIGWYATKVCKTEQVKPLSDKNKLHNFQQA